MQADWQNIVVLALVAMAATYVAWRAWGIVRHRGGGCGSGGGCNTCSQNQTNPADKGSLPLVELKPHVGPAESGKRPH